MFGILIIGLIWIDYLIAKYMISKKTTSGNRLDMRWKDNIDIYKNSRKIQCKYCQENFQFRHLPFQILFGLYLKGCWIQSVNTRRYKKEAFKYFDKKSISNWW